MKYILAGTAAAAGVTGAFLGVRSLVNRRRRRRLEYRYPESSLDWTGEVRQGSQPQQRVGARVESTRYQPHDQPDRLPVPTTGAAVPVTETMSDVNVQSVQVSDLSGPLFQYLLGFNDMLVQLRARRRSSEGNSGRSLMPADRASFQETLDRLENSLANVAEGNLEDGSLQARIYRLMVKVRDALQNLNYNDDDLFRINGEVRSEACSVLREIQSEDLDFIRVRQAYECE